MWYLPIAGFLLILITEFYKSTTVIMLSFPTMLQPGRLYDQLREFYGNYSVAVQDIIRDYPDKWLEKLPAPFPIKALAWKQPFATLMLYGKQETRKWDTNVRGIVLITSSKQTYSIEELKETSGDLQMQRMIIFKDDPNFDKKGYAIGVGILTGSRHMTADDENDTFVQYKEPWIEYHNSKYKKGKPVEKRLWVHEYPNIYPIEPFEFTGNQRWTNLDHETIKKVTVLPKLY